MGSMGFVKKTNGGVSMKKMEATATKARGFSKTLRLLVAGALVLTFFNCSVIAYADGEETGDADPQVVSTETDVQSTDVDVQAGDTESTTGSDILTNACSEIEAIVHESNGNYFTQETYSSNIQGYFTYSGIHLNFDANAGDDEVTDVPDQDEFIWDNNGFVEVETPTYVPTDEETDGKGNVVKSYILGDPDENGVRPYIEKAAKYEYDEDGYIKYEYDKELGYWVPVYVTDADGNYVYEEKVIYKVDADGNFFEVDAKVDGDWNPVYDDNGNVVNVDSLQYKKQEDNYLTNDNYKGQFIIPDKAPEREGYNFLNWNTKKDGTGDAYQPGESFFSYFCSTLFAIWEKIFGPADDPINTPTNTEQPTTPPATDDPTTTPVDDDDPIVPIVPGSTTPQGPAAPTGGNGTGAGAGGTSAPIAPVEFSSIGDNGNPLGIFDSGHGYGCWVHWWILLGMLITCAMSVLVLNRRERFISKLNRVEEDIVDNRVSVPANAGSTYVPVGVTA